MKLALLLSVFALLIAGCGSPANTGTVASAASEATAQNPAKLIDVRTPAEYERGHVRGAINIPVDELEKRIGESVPDKSARLQVHCQSGRRSAIAKSALEGLGYKNVEDLGSFAHARQVIEGK